LSTISVTELALFISQRPVILKLAIELNKNNNISVANFNNNNININSINSINSSDVIKGTTEVCIIL